MRVGVVIPVGPGREENLRRCLASIECQTRRPDEIVVVFDGGDAVSQEAHTFGGRDIRWCVPQHHVPGMEQPRNVGVKRLSPDVDLVWFVDSDIVFDVDALEHLVKKQERTDAEVVIAPYDWMPAGTVDQDVRNDPRWAMMNEPRWILFSSIGELNVGLACFSGNLLYRVATFKLLGGFWSEIHHGRCEDGELGLRAVASGVSIACEPRARGYHLHHPVNMQLNLERNERDVPMLNARHPWVEDAGLRVVLEDGTRFDVICPRCKTQLNTLLWWEHHATCDA